MYMTPSNNAEPQTPTSTQYPLRPASKVSPFRINVKKSLRLHPVASLVAGLLVLGVGLAVIAKHKPNYVSVATLYVSPTTPKTLVDDQELQRPYDTYMAQTVHAINRYDIMAAALQKLPPGTWTFPGETEQSAVQRLQQGLDIARVGTTYQVQVALDGARPEHLAEIVNTVTAVYLEKAKSEEFYGRDERLATLREERNKVETERDDLLKEQNKITSSLGVAAFNGTGSNLYDSQNAKMQADLLSAHEARVQAEAALNALRNGDPSAPSSSLNAAADEVIANDSSLMALKTQLSGKKAMLIDQLSGMTALNPARKQTEDQLAQIEKELSDMQSRLRTSAATRLEQKARTALNSATMVESRLQNDLLRGTSQAHDAAPRIQRAEAIQADLARLQNRYSAIDDRISNLELESSSPGSVHLFSPAMTPLGPERSKIAVLLIAIVPLALMVGIITAIILDLLDPHIYTGTDVEAVLGFAPIGMLFDDREVTQIVFDECALRLAAGVDHAARLAGARTFVITGVNTGAGTTSIIENLGSMLAKLGRKTLVIDPSGNNEPVAFVTLGTDLQRRPISFTDGSPIEPTTSTQLQTVKPGRQSLPARITPMNSFVFDSFKTVSAGYDIVLIDAAPLLLSAETEYLARMADVTVLVAEAGRTKKAWLNRAARLLERLGVAGAAAIVNKVHPARAEEALKHDLREFELRTDRVNLQEWWKPGKKASRTAAPAESFESGQVHAPEEDSVYARDAS
jgi:succinoglycan biosynthesis transport protein ExoP